MNLELDVTDNLELKPKVKKAKKTLTVRMYDVGFGDCFLLLIPKEDGKNLKILIDCGSIKLGQHDTPIKKVAEQVINDVRESPDDAPWIDVLVVTHRHKDHLSGFDDAAWGEVKIGEVWMPWTEKPNDPDAKRVRELHARLAESLVNRLDRTMKSAPNKLELNASYEMAMNAMSNEGALNTLSQGFANQPVRRYLPEANASSACFTTSALPGVSINVLGPSRDPDVISEMDPPAGQSYLKMITSGAEGAMEHPMPFRKDWIVDLQKYKSEYSDLDLEIPEADRGSVREASYGMDAGMASALDRALNGTSLTLVFQIGKAVLLFPGDAQWGTWRLALENPEFRKLLETVTFYKVGHHGSHNATPVEFVEKLMGKAAKEVMAMISVNATSNWPMVPKEELVAELQNMEKCKVARSDRPGEAEQAGFTLVGEGVIEAHVPF